MKHAVLINNAHLENFSVRNLGAYLKSCGFKVSTIHHESRKEAVFDPLSEQALHTLAEYCRTCDLVGITILTTHLLPRSIQITRYLKPRIAAPIIWGGPPVIADPACFLTYCDLVCAGEGEQVMEQLLQGVPVHKIPGLGYRSGTGVPVINPLPPMLDVNQLPIPKVDLEHGYILRESGLLPLKSHIPASLSTYSILLVRGCPYQCSYCLNSRLMAAFAKKGPYVRKITVDRVIRELEWAKDTIPHLRRIIIDDDDFFLNAEDRMQQFLARYMAKIALPVFYLQANTRQITRAKVNILADSGLDLRYLKIGLQSGSVRISKDLYNRPLNRQAYLEKLTLVIHRNIRIMIDVISDNPYETMADKHEVLLFYLDILDIVMGSDTIDQPVTLYDHKLMYFPGTPLYERAMKDRHIPCDYVDQVLFRRSTLRHHREDSDNDALIVALFNIAARKQALCKAAHIVLKILAIRPVFKAITHMNPGRHLHIIMQIPGVGRLVKKLLPTLSVAKKQ
jgi:anaerobic magnesium-protoporphyrin IX monomethyl ester cyclase